jgi:hypothetical protein
VAPHCWRYVFIWFITVALYHFSANMLTTRRSYDVYLQGSERGAYDKITAKMTEAPGPGYYNYRSDFDLPEHGGNSYADTNFLMQLNAARKRQSAVFESRTGRDALMQVRLLGCYLTASARVCGRRFPLLVCCIRPQPLWYWMVVARCWLC